MEKPLNNSSTHEDDNNGSFIIETTVFPLVKPKFTKAQWQSGEGGGQDHGENPTDSIGTA